jgi:hypothetical protein
VPQTARGWQLPQGQPARSAVHLQSLQPGAQQSSSAGDAIAHIVVGLVVIGIAGIAWFAGCPIVWIGGFIWGAIEIIRGLATLGGGAGGGLP